MKTWTQAEIDTLKENYDKVTNVELSKLLPDKSKMAIYKKASALGLRKPKEIESMNRSISYRGEKGSNWKGGVSKTSNGYRLVKMPEHRRANNNGYVLEHILIFEKHTGIIVPENCCIHHLNGNKMDNRIENLCMMTHAAHTALHNFSGKRKKKVN